MSLSLSLSLALYFYPSGSLQVSMEVEEEAHPTSAKEASQDAPKIQVRRCGQSLGKMILLDIQGLTSLDRTLLAYN